MDDDAGEMLEMLCPTCGEVQAHTILRAADSGFTLRCDHCKKVRTLPAPPRERVVDVPLILSQGAQSQSLKLTVSLDGLVAVDDEYDLEGTRIRITGIECPDGTLPDKTKGRNIRILKAVKFDTVTLLYSVNDRESTKSFLEEVVPETVIEVGLVRMVQGTKLVVKTLKSDQNRTLHRGELMARNIRRVFADLAPPKSKVGQPAPVRRRGDPKKNARAAAARSAVKAGVRKSPSSWKAPPKAAKSARKPAPGKSRARGSR